MGKESKYFGAPEFSPRERWLLRGQHYWRVLGEYYMRWRLRDRVDFGAGCRIDPGTMVVAGLGAVELGPGVIIDRGVHKMLFHVEPHSRVRIGAGSWFQTNIDDMVFSCKEGAEIVVGKHSWMAGGLFAASSRITVGERAQIGYGCIIVDSDMHRMDNNSPPPESAPVKIGAHVWMPSRVHVTKGVTIGDHCVIGAGSLVTCDLPDCSLAYGRPARVIKKIAPRDQVDPL